MKKNVWIVFLVLSLWMVGCFSSQVQVKLPASNASKEQRLEAFQQHKKAVHNTRFQLNLSRYGSSITTFDSIFLQNGLELKYPRDMLFLADENSSLHTEISDMQTSLETGYYFQLGGYSGYILSLIPFTVGVIALLPSSDPTTGVVSNNYPLAYSMLGLGTAMAITGAVLHIVGAFKVRFANERKLGLFARYDLLLRDRLRVQSTQMIQEQSL